LVETIINPPPANVADFAEAQAMRKKGSKQK